MGDAGNGGVKSKALLEWRSHLKRTRVVNMSEYQCYEFVAVDQPLTAKQIDELGAISTRAEISPTRFWNEYHYGSLKADPAKLLARYFDAHLYFANWGTRRLMLRVPQSRVDVKVLKSFFVGSSAARITLAGKYAILAFDYGDEENDDDDGTIPGSLSALLPLRSELLQGDLRCAYLAWLFAVQNGNVKDGTTEPPVPAGLGSLTGAQQALVEFLRIDCDLLAAAKRGSVEPEDDDTEFRRWVKHLSMPQKDHWLLKAVTEPTLALGTDLLRAFRATRRSKSSSKGRTVRVLREMVADECDKRESAEAARKQKAKNAAEKSRNRRLNLLRSGIDAAWSNLEKLIAASDYDKAVKLAIDLKDVATSDGQLTSYQTRFEAMRKRQLRRRGFFDRWKSKTKHSNGES